MEYPVGLNQFPTVEIQDVQVQTGSGSLQPRYPPQAMGSAAQFLGPRPVSMKQVGAPPKSQVVQGSPATPLGEMGGGDSAAQEPHPSLAGHLRHGGGGGFGLRQGCVPAEGRLRSAELPPLRHNGSHVAASSGSTSRSMPAWTPSCRPSARLWLRARA
ncbi:UNVERIFIED_CONTAM: hypothetical protein Sangu_2240900 [Sesamum angustifolium]|uniref:Uncharacterized protein n=1 Tax=Sesamum angustifolium TaxID=2727405 RepID=A0AAW2L3R9_9LAMI